MDIIARGVRASQLLENELFIEAFDKIKEKYIDSFINSEVRDDDGRQRIYLAIHQLEEVKAYFEVIVSTGDFEVLIKEKESMSQKVINKFIK